MSKYTIRLNHMIRSGWIPPLDDYPIFNEDYRPILNNHIIEHFLMEEIGVETVQLFNRRLHSKMMLIMPKYNKMYKLQEEMMEKLDTTITEVYKKHIDELSNTDLKALYDTERFNTQADTVNRLSKDDMLEKFLNTPHSSVNHIDDGFLTTVTKNEDKTQEDVKSNTTANMRDNKSNDTKSRRKGDQYITFEREYHNPQTDLEVILKVNSNLLNIDEMILNELEPLFMGIY